MAKRPRFQSFGHSLDAWFGTVTVSGGTFRLKPRATSRNWTVSTRKYRARRGNR